MNNYFCTAGPQEIPPPPSPCLCIYIIHHMTDMKEELVGPNFVCWLIYLRQHGFELQLARPWNVNHALLIWSKAICRSLNVKLTLILIPPSNISIISFFCFILLFFPNCRSLSLLQGCPALLVMVDEQENATSTCTERVFWRIWLQTDRQTERPNRPTDG